MKKSKNFNEINFGEEFETENPEAFVNSFTGETMNKMVEQSSFYIHVGSYYGAYDGNILLKGNDTELKDLLTYLIDKYPKFLELNPEIKTIKV